MLTATSAPALTVGVSLKMYFGHARTIAWARAVADIAREHPAVTSGAVDLFVAPTFPSLVPVHEVLAGTRVHLGAQDLATADEGAFTGEVSGAELHEIGCDLVEIGHAERRSLFGEDDRVVADKVQAAFRNHLTPLICVGEPSRASSADAIADVTGQLDRSVDGAVAAGIAGPVVVAYEPVWAIGAPEPAPDAFIVDVLAGIAAHVAARPELAGSRVIYGGSAGPGLLTRGAGGIRGLFLGRFAHDPAAIRTILDEAAALGEAAAPEVAP
ncbi:triose-phosphate isomerase family protein [Curtobacterium sp. Leaf261]|uniref:triose-phosphate isomerase family protein n=1 Tax=Curtobacterium sp. Leaf261 TaxID=1736311 RepID=UPI0006F5547D|nr:triose-phosphate isomerase family protein [Curtobacterium sp. Leaf261]KQO59781.1 triosephosphate isomerase [Curtobacterium sp. Leaf261]